MKELIRTIVTPLVDFPDDVKVEREAGDHVVNYVLTVNKQDMGKVIGKRGRIAGAVRTIVNASGMAKNERVHLTINE